MVPPSSFEAILEAEIVLGMEKRRLETAETLEPPPLTNFPSARLTLEALAREAGAQL